MCLFLKAQTSEIQSQFETNVETQVNSRCKLAESRTRLIESPQTHVHNPGGVSELAVELVIY